MSAEGLAQAKTAPAPSSGSAFQAPSFETRSVFDRDAVTSIVHVLEVAKPRAVVHLSHGVGEHAMRYRPLIERLAASGYTVVADDHRGHGQSGLLNDGLSKLGPRGVRGAIDAVETVAARARQWYPGLPLVSLGHSWGSLMLQRILYRDTGIYDGAILSGTSLAMPGILKAGNFNQRWNGKDATGYEWLSRDPQVWAAAKADPLMFDISVKSPLTLIEGTTLVGMPPSKLSHKTPILIVGGTEDVLGGPRGMVALARVLREHSKLPDVTVKGYRDARHEVFNEYNREQTTRDVIDWLHERF